jgi:hypothetical protein
LSNQQTAFNVISNLVADFIANEYNSSRQIDQLVYKLYGLTEQEMEIVEKNLE